MHRTSSPVVIVGGGLAGLATALQLRPLPVTLVTAGPLGGQCSTALAQGGIAAAIGPGDSAEQHALDTLGAAAGLGREDVAASIASQAQAAIGWLEAQGVRFDRDRAGRPATGLEAAHARPRILHAGGDRTGLEIMRALSAAVRASPSIETIEDGHVAALSRDVTGAVDGVLLRRGGNDTRLGARAVVLATGGIGGLYAHTTNPLASVGSGLALAARAGAVLRDLEFVQFHPTAIDVGGDPMPLATEALRGEGARLVTAAGEDAMAGVEDGALAARDIVAAMLFARVARGEKVFLELPHELARDLPRRFPGVAELCAHAGLDPAARRIPVRPAAHYHMGGLRVDAQGRTSLEGLWACGEVASTGLHGANRLASNSLLEAVVCARAVAADIAGLPVRAAAGTQPVAAARGPGGLGTIRPLMDRHVGVVRDARGLAHAIRVLAPLALGDAPSDPALAALMIAIAAHERRESRGAHRRLDHPTALPTPRSQEITLATAAALARELADAKVEPR